MTSAPSRRAAPPPPAQAAHGRFCPARVLATYLACCAWALCFHPTRLPTVILACPSWALPAADGQRGAAADPLAQPDAAARRPQAAALLPASQVRLPSMHPPGCRARAVAHMGQQACSLPWARLALAHPVPVLPQPCITPPARAGQLPRPLLRQPHASPRCAAMSNRTRCPGGRQTARQQQRAAWPKSQASRPRSGRASGDPAAPTRAAVTAPCSSAARA